MRTIRTVAELRAHTQRVRADGRTIGLVPTMGAFHAGHESLMRAAREAHDEVYVSLFVNPTQFDEGADLAAYPRNEAEDAARAAELGVDVLFAPPVDEVYPPGFSTTVTVGEVAEPLEGEHRGPGHFAGVATVVTKLLNMAAPDVAYFGQKDAQQVAVIQRLVADLDIPVRIEVLPTIRDADGLALSSRNARLGPEERAAALSLHRALRAVEAAAHAGDPDPAAAGRATLNGHVDLEYLELVDPTTFRRARKGPGPFLAVIAARVGGTRLIDNQIIDTDRGTQT